MPLANINILSQELSDNMEQQKYKEIISLMVLDIDKIYWNDVQRKRLHDYLTATIPTIENQDDVPKCNQYNKLLGLTIGKTDPKAIISAAMNCYRQLGYTLEAIYGIDDIGTEQYYNLDSKNLQPEYLIKILDRIEKLIEERRTTINVLNKIIVTNNDMVDQIKTTPETTAISIEKEMEEVATSNHEILRISKSINDSANLISHLACQINGEKKFSALKEEKQINRVANLICQKNYVSMGCPSVKTFVNINVNSPKIDDAPIKQYINWSYQPSSTSFFCRFRQIPADNNKDWKDYAMECDDYGVMVNLQKLFGEDTFLQLAINVHVKTITRYETFYNDVTRRRKENITDHLNAFFLCPSGFFKTFSGVYERINPENVKINELISNVISSFDRNKFSSDKLVMVLNAIANNMAKKPTPKECDSIKKNIDILNIINTTDSTNIPEAVNVLWNIINYKTPRKKKTA